MVIENMQQALDFPEIKNIIPMLNENGGMKTAYKKVESWENLK